MVPEPSARALPLIQEISRAACSPDCWTDFVAALAAELDQAAVGLALDLPSNQGPALTYSANFPKASTGRFAEQVASGGLPWSLEDVSTEGFRSLSALLSDEALAETAYYRDYMATLDFAPEAPIAHIFAQRVGRPMAGIAVFRCNGRRPFNATDLQLLDLLAPHLAQAYIVHEKLLGHRHRSDAISQAVDRFPTGMLLIDEDGRVVESNRAATRIVERGDGLELRAGRPVSIDPHSDRALQKLLKRALDPRLNTTASLDLTLKIDRSNGQRPYTMLITRLLTAPEIGASHNIQVALFVIDPDERQLGMRSLLGDLYDLSPAEAELAALLSEGESLEGAASLRGVGISTARSQLKAIFRKTDTRRQGDLVALVLSGLTALERK